MTNRLTTKHWLIGIITLLVLFAINASISYKAISSIKENEEKNYETLSTLKILKDTYSSIQDAEIGHRGYLLTREESYLEPYHQSLDVLNIHLKDLSNRQDDLISVQIDGLVELINLKKSQLEEDVNLYRQREYHKALDRLLSGKGDELLKQIRDQVNQMEASEHLNLERRRAESKQSASNVSYTLVVVNFFGLLLALAISKLLHLAFKSKEEDNARLEQIIAVRTAEIQQYSADLKRSNRELQEFAFVASHDLQEPLRKIRAFGDRLQKKYSDQIGDGADYIERMQKAAMRMSVLINDLLSFSRVTTKTQPFTEVDLNQVTTDVLDDLSVAIEESEATVSYENLPKMEGDGTQLRQLIQNLLGNAIKFRRTAIPPAVEISCSEIPPKDPFDTRQWVELKISDNGIGIDQQYAERIFTPFQRLHRKEEYPGTGIGLAVCRRIVERHGGTITVVSIPNNGSTFIIHVPIQQEAPAIEETKDS